MDLRIDIKQDGELLCVTAGGNIDFDSAWQLLMQVFEAAVEKKAERVLVNALGLAGTLESFERYRLGTSISDYLNHRQLDLRLAFIGTPPTMNGFGVRLAQNRGIAAEVFTSREEAMLWLGEGEAAAPAQSVPSGPL